MSPELDSELYSDLSILTRFDPQISEISISNRITMECIVRRC
jgi:hypothetical protein